MLWIIYPVIAAFFWAIVEIIDRHIIKDELRDPWICTSIFGFTFYIIFAILAALIGNVFSIPITIIFLLILGGVISACASIFYYSALKKERISRLAPLFPTNLIWIIILSFFILNERLLLIQYIGISILLIGVILIAFKKGTKYKINFAALLILISTFAWAVRDLFIKLSSNLGGYHIFNILFWVFLGYFTISTIIFIIHHPKIIEKSKKGVEYIILNSFLCFIAYAIYVYAISKYLLSLVSALASITPLLVFLIVFLLTRVNSKLIYEKYSKHDLIINLMATIFVVIGAVLISV
ncbi:MAG: EamA family transporter [Candidatus Woesearchaeota archaeon]|nr:MAG: EamA family transporter [Candidatus Woesearchaeota archaeon]